MEFIWLLGILFFPVILCIWISATIYSISIHKLLQSIQGMDVVCIKGSRRTNHNGIQRKGVYLYIHLIKSITLCGWAMVGLMDLQSCCCSFSLLNWIYIFQPFNLDLLFNSLKMQKSSLLYSLGSFIVWLNVGS